MSRKGGENMIKYMNFNMSCSYAGLANLLMEKRIDTEDTEIVKVINIPYIFQYDKEQETYLAGPLLQGKKWFDYYLNPLGMMFKEEFIDKENVCKFLDHTKTQCMIGLNLGNRHAVIYQGKEQEKYKFLNNKRETDGSPDYYLFTEEELLEKLNIQNAIGYITHLEIAITSDNKHEICLSLNHLAQYKKELYTFCHQEQTPQTLRDTMNKLFAAPLLHVLSMMELIGETEMVEELLEIRTQYMDAIRQPQSLKLIDHIQYQKFENVLNNYQKLIINFLG